MKNKSVYIFVQSISLNLTVCLASCSDSDGGYMDMNKEESAQYVAMKELSYADIEPAVYETPYTAPGDTSGTLNTLITFGDSILS